MAAKGYLLSEADREAIQALLDATKARGADPAGRYGPDGEEGPAPSTYLAIPAEGGITALSRGADLTTGTGSLNSGLLDDQPGQGYCAVYRLVLGEPPNETPTLAPVESEVLVYNLTASVIPGHEWCLITRDRFGTWWVLPSIASSSAGMSLVGTAGLSLDINLITEPPADPGSFGNQLTIPRAGTWLVTAYIDWEITPSDPATDFIILTLYNVTDDFAIDDGDGGSGQVVDVQAVGRAVLTGGVVTVGTLVIELRVLVGGTPTTASILNAFIQATGPYV